MSDLIDRQAAIDICNSAIDLWHGQLGEGALVAVKEKIEGVPSAQLGTDCISRQAAIDALDCINGVEEVLRSLPSAQPEIIRCKDCKYWHSGSCEYPEHVVNSQDYYVGDIETEAEHFCGYADRREDGCDKQTGGD